MAFVALWSKRLTILLLFLQLLCQDVLGKCTDMAPIVRPKFGDTVQVWGAMEQTSQCFQDGFSMDILSPTNRTFSVQQNKTPLGAQFITGAKGAAGNFVALSGYSYIVQMSEPANDLIATLSVQYDEAVLKQNRVQKANTYVAVLAPDKMSWKIDESTRTVQKAENRTRIMKLSSVTGEYLLVGRQTSEMGNVFVQYGNTPSNMVNLTGGPGIQEVEFIDGLRMSVQSSGSLGINVELVEGVSQGILLAGVEPLNSFVWVVRTTAPKQTIQGTMIFPFNRQMLVDKRPNGSSPSTMLVVGRRPLNGTSGNFLPFNEGQQVVKELPEDRIYVSGVTQLDGQYLMMIVPPKNIKKQS